MNISIVPDVKTDPRQLLFHYPSMSAIKYSKLASEYYHYRMVKACEDMARIQNQILVPSSVIHWKRKKEINEDKRLKIGKHMYYVLKPSELSKNELKKLREYVSYGRNEEEEVFSPHTSHMRAF